MDRYDIENRRIRVFKMLVKPPVQTIVELRAPAGMIGVWSTALPEARVISIDNLQRLHELHIVPDVIYVDAQSAAGSNIAELADSLDQFPFAKVIGEDWNNSSARTVVERIASRRGLQIATCEGVWWFPTQHHSSVSPSARPHRDASANAKVVTLTTCRRPEYTKRVLDALSRCEGIENYRVLIHIEPGSSEVLQIARQARLANKTLIENVVRLGCGANTFSALDHGFQLADFVIHLEDDTVPAVDCLQFFEWARFKYRDDARVFSVAAYSRAVAGVEHCHRVQRVPWFTPWGWGTWWDRWQEISEHWTNEPVTWDVALNHELRGDRVEIQPVLARTQNIGAHRGEHCPSPEFHRENHFNPFGIWSVAAAAERPASFYE